MKTGTIVLTFVLGEGLATPTAVYFCADGDGNLPALESWWGGLVASLPRAERRSSRSTPKAAAGKARSA